jgi:hypothetical protein
MCVRQLGGCARDEFLSPLIDAAAREGWSAQCGSKAPGAIERRPIEHHRYDAPQSR